MEEQLITGYLLEDEKAVTYPPCNNGTTPRKMPTKPKKVAPMKVTSSGGEIEMDVHIPVPKDGRQYEKSEACRIILQNTRKKSDHRATMMNKMFALNWDPTSVRSLQILLKKYEANDMVILKTPWTGQ